MRRQKNQNRRIAAFLMALVLVVGVMAGTTLAAGAEEADETVAFEEEAISEVATFDDTVATEEDIAPDAEATVPEEAEELEAEEEALEPSEEVAVPEDLALESAELEAVDEIEEPEAEEVVEEEPAQLLSVGEGDGIALVDDATYTWSGDSSALSESEGTITISGDGTLTLSADTTANIVISSGTVTLDLGGCTLTGSNTDTISNHGTLTIPGSGTVMGPAGYGAIVNYPGGTVTINGAAITNATNDWYCIKNMGTMTIDNATVSFAAGGGNGSLIVNGWYDAKTSGTANTHDRDTLYSGTPAQMTINGGSFEGSPSTTSAIKNDDYGVLVINGGTFSSSTGVALQNAHVATINGGEFSVGTSNSSGVIHNRPYNNGAGDAGELTITGGTFNAENGQYIVYFYSSSGTNGSTVTIEGGEFTGAWINSSNYNNYNTTVTIKVSGGTFDGETGVEVTLLQSKATDAVAKLSVDDDCYYVGADLIEAAVEAYTGTDELTLTVIQGDLSLSVDACLYVVNTGSGTVEVNGVTISAGTSEPIQVHNLTHVEAKDATCTEAGNIEYWYCETHGVYFKDEAAAEEITEEDTVIAALGHSWSDEPAATWTENEDGTYSVSVTWTCLVCGETYKDSAVATEKEGTDGNTYYVAYVNNPDGIEWQFWKLKDADVEGDEPVPGTDEPDNTTPPTTETEPGPVVPSTGVPQTGDTTNMALWIALFAAALAGIGGGCVLKLKQRGAGKHNRK